MALFHDSVVRYIDDVVGEGADDPQVVADKHIGKIAFVYTAQEVDDLRLYRPVERGGRLVQHDEFLLEHDGLGDGDRRRAGRRKIRG